MSVALPVVSGQQASATKQAWVFVVLAIGGSFLIWIPGILLHVTWAVLIFGSAATPMAAILLSRSGQRVVGRSAAVRWIWFGAFLLPCWAVLLLMPDWLVPGDWPLAYKVLLVFPAAVPAWVATAGFSRDQGIRSFLRTMVRPEKWRWQAFALLFPPAMLGIPAVLAHFAGLKVIWPQVKGSVWTYIAAVLLSFVFNFLYAGVMEEPGWRGFLLPRLQHRFSPLIASLLVWLPWALIHVPLDLGRPGGTTLVEFLQMRVIYLIPSTVLFTWLYNRTRGNLLCLAIFHASCNCFPGFVPTAPSMFPIVVPLLIYAVAADRMWRRDESVSAATAVAGR